MSFCHFSGGWTGGRKGGDIPARAFFKIMVVKGSSERPSALISRS